MEKNPKKDFKTGLALAIAGSIAFSGKAIIVKLAYRYESVDALSLIMWRMLFALPFFILMAYFAGRGKPPLTKKDWAGAIGLGITGYYLASTLDFMGLQYISASLERLIMYLTPTLVLFLAYIFGKSKITRGHIIALIISYSGALIVFGKELQMPSNTNYTYTAIGAALVFASIISYAIYLFYSGEFVKRLGSLRLVGLATSIACILCIAQFLIIKPISAAILPAPVIWLSLLNAIACTVLPVLMMMMAIERLGSNLAAQIGMIGPISTIFMGIFILGEEFTIYLAIGTILVMAGITLFTKAGR